MTLEIGDERIGRVAVADEKVGSVSLLDILIALGGEDEMIESFEETFTFADFVDVDPPNGNFAAEFAGTLPHGAIPLGAVYEVVTPFDFTVGPVDDPVAGQQLAGPLLALSAGVRSSGGSTGNFAFGPGTHPSMQAVSGQPTQGEVTVTLYYLDTAAA